MAEKITPTPDDVLDAATRWVGKFRRPLTSGDITWILAPDGAGTVADAKRFVHTATVAAALTALTEDGTLVARTGLEWSGEYGVVFAGCRYATVYYAPRADADRWAQERADRIQAAADAQADAYALARIRVEHPDLLAAYHAEYHAR